MKQEILSTSFTKQLNIQFPLIMAPMFLVSNTTMVKEGMSAGIVATFPTLNFRNEGELETVLDELNETLQQPTTAGTYGVNLIVQKTNPLYKKHLDLCIAKKVPFFITSLGNPKEVIEQAHLYGAKVYCDVTNLIHAEKVVSYGCDGLIAVGQGAGGHAGSNAQQIFIPALKKRFPNLPIIAAGGVATGAGLASMMLLGASGASVGTRFIASNEATVTEEYKTAILNASIDDIVMTDKISGTPCTVINTEYVKKIGTKQNWIERFLSKNKTTKKYFKMLVQLKGMKSLEKSALSATYKTVFCAGQTVELIDRVETVNTIVENFVEEYRSSIAELPKIERELHVK